MPGAPSRPSVAHPAPHELCRRWQVCTPAARKRSVLFQLPVAAAACGTIVKLLRLSGGRICGASWRSSRLDKPRPGHAAKRYKTPYLHDLPPGATWARCAEASIALAGQCAAGAAWLQVLRRYRDQVICKRSAGTGGLLRGCAMLMKGVCWPCVRRLGKQHSGSQQGTSTLKLHSHGRRPPASDPPAAAMHRPSATAPGPQPCPPAAHSHTGRRRAKSRQSVDTYRGHGNMMQPVKNGVQPVSSCGQTPPPSTHPSSWVDCPILCMDSSAPACGW